MKGIFINIVNKFLTTSGFFLTLKINYILIYNIDYQLFINNKKFKTLMRQRVSGVLGFNANYKNLEVCFGLF